MLTQIKEKYKGYNDIFNSMESLDKIVHPKAKILLENSLYLSVFTIFENFLKSLIENYLDNVCKKGIKFTDLSSGFACSIFVSKEKRIKHIFETTEEKQIDSFKSYFELIKNDLTKEDLHNYIHFEFLHENKLNGYYKDLFEQIIGERDFLTNLKLKEDFNDFDGLINIQGDAFTFLREYTSKVRNNIAHENQAFKIEGFSSFQRVTDAFFFIIEAIVNKYQNYTGFSFEIDEKNILDEF
jgi:hypothetical protein